MKPVTLKNKWKNERTGCTFPKGTVFIPSLAQWDRYSDCNGWFYMTPDEGWGDTLVEGTPGLDTDEVIH